MIGGSSVFVTQSDVNLCHKGLGISPQVLLVTDSAVSKSLDRSIGIDQGVKDIEQGARGNSGPIQLR